MNQQAQTQPTLRPAALGETIGQAGGHHPIAPLTCNPARYGAPAARDRNQRAPGRRRGDRLG